MLHRKSCYRLLALGLLLCLFGVADLAAQASLRRVENPFTSLSVATDLRSGKFFLATGAQFGHQRYMFTSSRTSKTITSFVVFRVGTEVYYCNVPQGMTIGGRPISSSGDVPYKPYDSIYVGTDTIETIWKNVGPYTVIMRFIAEPPRHAYDDGADIVLEFDYEHVGFLNKELGIFMMLDWDNGMINNGTQADNSSALTNEGYYPSQDYGVLFQKRFGQIPEFYEIGDFEFREPLNDVFPIHRITGTSLGGKPLTTPDILSIGNWRDFQSLSWDINSDVEAKQIGDIAAVLRWGDLTGKGIVRTSFGTTSRTGNNLFHCRDSGTFVNIRTTRLVTQAQIGGPYTPNEFDVEMWVTNLQTKRPVDYALRLENPILSRPDGTRRLTLDPSTPAERTLSVGPKGTEKLTWRVRVNTASTDTLAELRFTWRDSVSGLYMPMLRSCNPLVTVLGAEIPNPPPVDDRPPVVTRTGSGRDTKVWWTYSARDRRANFEHDKGIDVVEVVENQANNFRLTWTPDPFRRCDTSVVLALRAEVIDTSKGGRILFRVRDCAGNITYDSALYNPRPDLFVPEVVRVDSIDRFDPSEYPCAVPVYEVYLEDRRNQRPDAGDNGFGEIEVLSSTNFLPIELNFDKGGQGVADFDPTASFRLRVDDVLLPASAVIRVADYAGNADTLRFDYCTIPDRLPPVVTVVDGAGSPVKSWTIDASDIQSWDRGLAEVVEISRTNMTVTPWPVPVTAGQPTANGIGVAVIDDAFPGELTLEFRDTYYRPNDASTHATHATRVTIRYTGIDDTLAPVITYRRNTSVPSEVVFDVTVEDIHTINGEPYQYDLGLESVTWTLTPNMRIRTPIAFSADRKTATFQAEIIDPLSTVEGDTICVTAVDSARNSSALCQEWPTTPDGKSPIFIGILDAGRTAITGTATDDREFDRGLGSVVLRNAVNLQPFSMTALNGAPSLPVSIAVVDPTKALAGEIVVRDLIADLSGGPETGIHTVIIPFSLPVVDLSLHLPADIVEGGQGVTAAIVAQSAFAGSEVSEIELELQHTTNGTFAGTVGGVGLASFVAAPAGTGRLRVTMTTASTAQYAPGDTLGVIRFTAGTPFYSERFLLDVVPGSLTIDDNVGRVIEVRTPGDPLASRLTLPVPFARILADSVAVINGECGRVLDGRTIGKSGLAILQVQPHPVSLTTGGATNLVVRDLPPEGAVVEIISVTGERRASMTVQPSGAHLTLLALPLPDDIESGVWFVRLSGSTGEDEVKIMVTR